MRAGARTSTKTARPPCGAAPPRPAATRPATCGPTGSRPADTIPIGPTTILARTDLVRAAPMGGLVQGEDYCAALGVTALASGILLPTRVQISQVGRADDGPGRIRPAGDGAREHAWQYGRSLRAVLRGGEDCRFRNSVDTSA